MHISKFNSINGIPDQNQIQEWAEDYFQNLLMMLNSFLAHASVEEAVQRMEQVPFRQLVTEALEGESEAIIKLAVEIIGEKAASELEYMRAYLE